jgi:hypothetical protein
LAEYFNRKDGNNKLPGEPIPQKVVLVDAWATLELMLAQLAEYISGLKITYVPTSTVEGRKLDDDGKRFTQI